MSVGNCCHGIDLEILVGSETGSVLARSPVSETWLSIVEPLVTELLDVVGIKVRHTLGDLRASHATSSLEHLLSNLLVLITSGTFAHELGPHGVSATDNLDLVDVITIESGSSKANPVHLADEDLVTEEVATPETAVRVGVVLASLKGHVWELTKDTLSRVVLLLGIIEMLGVLLDVVVSDHVSQELERVVILVVDRWGIVEDTNVNVVHLVVSHHQQRWCVNTRLRVLLNLIARLVEATESGVDLLDKGVVLDTTGTNNDDVLTSVVS